MGVGNAVATTESEQVGLPDPIEFSALPVEEAIAGRRSIREFVDAPLSDDVISRLLWSAQGITDAARGLRATPSAGATYPLEFYWIDRRGVFRYVPEDHGIEKVVSGDHRSALSEAALGQRVIEEAPVSFIITAVLSRTAGRYGEMRAERYVHMESGHAAQNIHLQAVALELGSVPVGAFQDDQVQSVLNLPQDHEPLYIIPVGAPR
ncbi:MAG: SagB/ThcOx family dehydrogenase [Gammaproteobacteria bacterium]|nr:MAG: SagB/ThcOx family dehydrogenase [Gammaproteobacteria bacterium]